MLVGFSFDILKFDSMTLSLGILQKIGEWLGKLVTFTGTGVGLVVWIFDLGNRVIGAGLGWISGKLDVVNPDAWDNVSFAGVAFIGYANAVFPLTEAVQIWSSLATACLAISAIRWVKSFIPTIAN